MSRTKKKPREVSSRRALRRRVNQMYEWFNQEAWGKCFFLVDPRLRERGSVDHDSYTASLQEFKDVYGHIAPRFVEVSLHLDASSNKKDDRPFAYLYVLWQDQTHAFHLFRERWVQDSGRWYTRVAGLVANKREPISTDA